MAFDENPLEDLSQSEHDAQLAYSEIADLKRQLAKVESQRDFWYEACQEDELNDEIDDLKRQLAEAKDPHSDEQEPTFLNRLLRQRDSLQDQLTALKRELAEAKKLIFTNRELDGLLERWDQTPPELQRHIVAAFSARLAALREQNAKLRDGLVAIGLAAGEQKRRGEPMVHDAIIDLVKFVLRDSDEREAKDG